MRSLTYVRFKSFFCLILIGFTLTNFFRAEAKPYDLAIPSSPEDIYIFSDLDYTWFGRALFTPIRVFLRAEPGSSADIQLFANLPTYIDLTEFEVNQYYDILGTAEITRGRQLVQLEKDPLGILQRPDIPVPLGFYFIDPNSSYSAFRDASYRSEERLVLDVQHAIERAQISKYKFKGPTYDVIKLMVNAGYSENVAIVTARGQKNEIPKLFEFLIQTREWDENTFGRGPHAFALSHASSMVYGHDGMGERKNLVLHHSIGVYNSHAAAAGKRRLVIVADDKPEYTKKLGDQLKAMSSVKTFRNLDYVLINTGDEEQRRNADYGHIAGYFKLGKYYALPDKFMKEVADKLKTNVKKVSKDVQNQGAGTCEIFLR